MKKSERTFAVALLMLAASVLWAGDRHPHTISELEFGPIDGLTTVFHPAAENLTVPRNTNLQLMARVPVDARLLWGGAQQMSQQDGVSLARVNLTTPGIHRVTLQYGYRDGSQHYDRLDIRVLEETLDDVVVSPVQASAEALELDEDDLRASAYRYFTSGSIAGLTRLGDEHYRTSSNREISLQTTITPAALAPILEWRFSDGRIMLGDRINAGWARGNHHVSVGTTNDGREVLLDIYDVRITSHRNGNIIADGEEITFIAETIPAGYEGEITWLASTRFGVCNPATGSGSSFTVFFQDTYGSLAADQNPFQWLGVRADNAIFEQDKKPLISQGLEHMAVNARAANTAEGLQVKTRGDEAFGVIVGLDESTGYGYEVSGLPPRIGASHSLEIRGDANGEADQLLWTRTDRVVDEGFRHTLGSVRTSYDVSPAGGDRIGVIAMSSDYEVLYEGEFPNGPVMDTPYHATGHTGSRAQVVRMETKGGTILATIETLDSETVRFNDGTIVDGVFKVIVNASAPAASGYLTSARHTGENQEDFMVKDRNIIVDAALYRATGHAWMRAVDNQIRVTGFDGSQPFGLTMDTGLSDLTGGQINKTIDLEYAGDSATLEFGLRLWRHVSETLEQPAADAAMDTTLTLNLNASGITLDGGDDQGNIRFQLVAEDGSDTSAQWNGPLSLIGKNLRTADAVAMTDAIDLSIQTIETGNDGMDLIWRFAPHNSNLTAEIEGKQRVIKAVYVIQSFPMEARGMSRMAIQAQGLRKFVLGN